MPALTISKASPWVTITNHEIQDTILLDWRRADALVAALRRRDMERETVDTDLRVLREQDSTIIEHRRQVFLQILAVDEVPRAAFCDAIASQARQLEEEEKHEAIAQDAAILFRAGAPFGLTDNPEIQREAVTEAAWGKLRRYMPKGIESQEVVGVPSLVQHSPDEPFSVRMQRMSTEDKRLYREILERERDERGKR